MKDKFYLTKQGLKKLEKEYDDLNKLRIAKTKGDTPSVLQSDDLNPEYVAFREDLSFLESRIHELKHVLKNVELIKLPSKEDRSTVHVGATVVLEESDGQINELMVVGTLEANPSEGKISLDSPVGKTLLGKKIGEKVAITSPIKINYKIKEIRYQSL